jgi:hypothetical protein
VHRHLRRTGQKPVPTGRNDFFPSEYFPDMQDMNNFPSGRFPDMQEINFPVVGTIS